MRKLNILLAILISTAVAGFAMFAAVRVMASRFSGTAHGGALLDFPIVKMAHVLEVQNDPSHRYYEVCVVDEGKSPSGEQRRLELVGQAMRERLCPDYKITNRRVERHRICSVLCGRREGNLKDCHTINAYHFYYTVRAVRTPSNPRRHRGGWEDGVGRLSGDGVSVVCIGRGDNEGEGQSLSPSL